MQMDSKGKYSIIRVEEDLTSEEQTNEFKDFVQNAIDGGSHHIVFDFSKIQVINSNGIGKILLFYKKLKEYNGSIGFLSLQSNVRELFDKLMFFNLFKEYKSESELED